MYDQTIERIRNQSTGKAKLGLKVLSMVFGATRPLKIDELRQALVIQQGDTHLDVEALVDVETLLSVTAGLVITNHEENEEPESFRLVHYTPQEYLETNQARHFPT